MKNFRWMQTRSIQAKQSFKNDRVSLASFYSTWIKRYKTSMTETYIWKSNNYLRHILLNLLSSSSILWIYFLSILKRQKERKLLVMMYFYIRFCTWHENKDVSFVAGQVNLDGLLHRGIHVIFHVWFGILETKITSRWNYL